MVTREGLPVSYEVFPGATFEGHTLIPLVKTMKQRYSLERVICVADRGMLNEENLKELEEAGAYYVVGAKLKQLSKAKQTKVLAKDDYQPLEGTSGKVLELAEDGRRLVVSWSPQRADKDAHDRQKAIEKLQHKLAKTNNPKELLNNYGYKKFLTIKGETEMSVNQDKIEQAQQWDGLHGVITNLPEEEKANDILGYYRGLWQVEDSFRVTKHDLKIRPVYHWTPGRVRAHIAIAFMAFTCVRLLMYRVKLQQKEAFSAAVIRNALLHVQTSILKDQKTGKRYAIPSNTSPEAKKLYQTMGLTLSNVPFALD
jgi:transposase